MGGKCDYNNSVEKFEQDSQSGPAPDRRINTMANCAIVGINWGDEGKGRMVDYLTDHYDVVVRYQGGGNAGHTVVNEKGKFALHLLPSGIFRDGVVNILGNGVALDIRKLVDELPKGPLWSRFSGKTSMSRSFWPFRNSGLFSPREPFALPPRRGSVFRCTGCFGHCKSRRARCAASPPPGAPGQSPRRPGRPARNPVCSTGGHPPCRCCPGPGRSSDCSIPRAPGPGAWIVWQWLRTALH